MILIIDESGEIYQYCLLHKRWIKWNVRVPEDDASSVALTYDERFLIIFSGWTKRPVSSHNAERMVNKIFVYDFRMRKFRKSKIESPSENFGYRYTSAITTRNEFAEELLVFGFVKKYIK